MYATGYCPLAWTRTQSWVSLFLAENTKRNEVSATTYQVRKSGKVIPSGENSMNRAWSHWKGLERTEDRAGKVRWSQSRKTLEAKVKSLGFFCRQENQQGYFLPSQDTLHSWSKGCLNSGKETLKTHPHSGLKITTQKIETTCPV